MVINIDGQVDSGVLSVGEEREAELYSYMSNISCELIPQYKSA